MLALQTVVPLPRTRLRSKLLILLMFFMPRF
jgi:hypothetical protein